MRVYDIELYDNARGEPRVTQKATEKLRIERGRKVEISFGLLGCVSFPLQGQEMRTK